MRTHSIDSVPGMGASKASGSVGRASQHTHPWRTSDGRKHPVSVRRVAVTR